MDEPLPSDAGQPDKTDTSLVSAYFEQRWFHVVSADPTFAVRLLNNCHTSLAPTATAKVMLNTR
jgi:hypothetical protein